MRRALGNQQKREKKSREGGREERGEERERTACQILYFSADMEEGKILNGGK